MSEKLLYYLGAGASAQVLPLAKRLVVEGENEETKVIPSLAEDIGYINLNSFDGVYDVNILQALHALNFRFKHFSKKGLEFGNVDTYAKYLDLINRGSEEFNELKQIISQYFTIKQISQNLKDARYRSWLINLMDTKLFPSNVKILNWNYDFQIQLAYQSLGTPAEDVSHTGTGFSHSPSLLSYFPNLDPTFSDFDKLSLIHLNGIAGYAIRNAQMASVFQNSYNNTIGNLITFILESNLHSNIHFAWEKGNYHDKLMNHINNMIKGTTIIIVIGYSFPFLNRTIDKQIIEFLKKDGSLKKIYCQDPKLDGRQLISQFDLPKDFDIVHIQSIDEFHIPFEY